MRGRNRKRRRGTAVLETALLATPIVLLLLGVFAVGMNLGRAVHAGQVNRDAASMYVRGVDFSKNGSKDVLVRLAQGLGMTRDGGDGVVILSKVTWMPQSKCTALALNPCNADKHVITQRLTVGNPALRQSALGVPDSDIVDSMGLVENYMQEPSAVAVFPYMQLIEGEFTYVTESYFSSPDFALPGFSTSGVYNIAMY